MYENTKTRVDTLFLDRDGVLNERLPGAYVRRWAEFRWLPGVLQALALLAPHFSRIFIVTNQQGIGKGLMTEQALAAIHQRMMQDIEAAGGRIDAIYHCPELASRPGNCRKPAPAMALRARADFPEVDFAGAVMVGDSLSDLQFGQQLGMYNVWISGKAEEETAVRLARQRGLRIDARFDGLLSFAAAHLRSVKRNQKG